MTKILIVDDEVHVREILSSLLCDKGYELEQAGSAEHARMLLGGQDFSLILLDIRLPGDSGLDLLQFVTEQHPDSAVVMVSGIDEPDVARKAFEHGAFGYILKPFEAHDVYVNVSNALRRRELEIENRDYREDLENKVAIRTEELQRSEQRLRLLLDSITAGVIIVRESDQWVVDVNQALVSMSGFSRERIIGLPCGESVCVQPIDQCPVPGGRSEEGCETELRTSTGDRIPILRAVRSVRIDGEDHFLATIIDISALKAMEKRVIQGEKMESLGQLAAGIAHEINTPTQYIGDNTRFLGETFPDLDGILGMVEELLEADQEGDSIDKIMEDIRDLIEDSDLKFLREEIPRAIEQTLEGVERISKIVSSMKQFAHPGQEQMSLVDLNEAIDKTITVARNEWKYVADLETDLEKGLPLVPCVQGEINQVLLNLVINAAHAIADAIRSQDNKKGWITISSRRAVNSVEVSVSDTGMGIPDDVRPKIFDPFYTTKEVGKGTGQGLAIAHKVVVEKHHGEILVDTEAGKGTTFTIRLPLEPYMSLGSGNQSAPAP